MNHGTQHHYWGNSEQARVFEVVSVLPGSCKVRIRFFRFFGWFGGSPVISNFAPGLSRCQKQQFFPHQVQINQGAHRKQLGGILLQSSIA
jgi:hypothetical protein